MCWFKGLLRVPYCLLIFVALLMWFDVIAPMAFLTDCSLSNQTDSPITFTPVGTVGPDGHRFPLPLYRTSFPSFRKSRLGHFTVAPSERFDFVYDMDDINFSEIVVEDAEGIVGQIVVNPNPTASQYIVPATTHVVIDSTSRLDPVPDNVANVHTAAQNSTRLWMFYAVSGMLLAFEGARSYMARRRFKKTVAA